MSKSVQFSNEETMAAVLGTHDRTLRELREKFDVRVVARDSEVKIEGEPENANRAAKVLEKLQRRVHKDEPVDSDVVDGIILSMLRFGQADGGMRIKVFYDNRLIVPKSPGQERYLRAISKSDIVFGIGPAGTGKTYLAVAMAISALREGQVRRIVLARPAVEAGERLGFLPGDMQEKVNPYLRPLYDALQDMMDFDQMQRYMDRDIIEVVPLAFMRGRTLNQAFIILDEAQNTTASQMMMFLTRLGVNSKAVITGDVTQIDLPRGEQSGLVESRDILRGVDGIDFVELDRVDIVRHKLVQDVVDAYESYRRRDGSEKQ